MAAVSAAGKRLRPAPGEENFSDFIRESRYYVDKTRYLKTIFESSAGPLLMLRPRRFDKTLMMSTIRYFFEMNYKTPGDTSVQQELFKGLAVMHDTRFCREHMGQYPVVSLSLKDTGGLNFRNACAMLGETIFDLALRFDWLRDSRILTAEEKEAFSLLLDRDQLCSGTADSINILQSSLLTLCTALFRHCGRKPLLLIDEYDVPLHKAAMDGYYGSMIKVIGPMLNMALKSDECISKVILAGCLRATKEGIFTGLSSCSVSSVLTDDDSLSAAFGFTPDEVQTMLSYYGLGNLHDRSRNFYCGYRIGSKEIFCPWDVTCYVSDLLLPRAGGPESFNPPAYWNRTTGSRIITEYMPHLSEEEAAMLQDLLDGGSAGIKVSEEMDYGDFSLDDAAQFWSLLVYTGYLTLEERGTDGVCRFRIPSAEIRKYFSSNIEAYYQRRGGAYFESCSRAVAEALLDVNAERLAAALNRALSTFVSIRGTSGMARGESCYHDMLDGIVESASSLITKHCPDTDEGEECADITILSDDFTAAMLLEIKCASSGSDLRCKAQEALRQIIDKDCAETMRYCGPSKIFGFGIAFFGRQCAVEAQELPL